MLQRIARTSMDQLAAFLTSPDIAPGTCAAGGGGPGGAEAGPERSLARSRRNIPHFPSAGRSDIAGYGGIPRCGQRRAGATAATPAGRVCGSFRGRDADIGGIEPLTGNSSFRRKLRHNDFSHIARPCPPCYDHAACGAGVGRGVKMSGKNGAIKLVAGNSNPRAGARRSRTIWNFRWRRQSFAVSRTWKSSSKFRRTSAARTCS